MSALNQVNDSHKERSGPPLEDAVRVHHRGSLLPLLFFFSPLLSRSAWNKKLFFIFYRKTQRPGVKSHRDVNYRKIDLLEQHSEHVHTNPTPRVYTHTRLWFTPVTTDGSGWSTFEALPRFSPRKKLPVAPGRLLVLNFHRTISEASKGCERTSEIFDEPWV